MSTLIETLKENSPDLYKRAMTHVTLDEIEHIGSDFHKLTKPVYAVLDTENNLFHMFLRIAFLKDSTLFIFKSIEM